MIRKNPLDSFDVMALINQKSVKMSNNYTVLIAQSILHLRGKVKVAEAFYICIMIICCAYVVSSSSSDMQNGAITLKDNLAVFDKDILIAIPAMPFLGV